MSNALLKRCSDTGLPGSSPWRSAAMSYSMPRDGERHDGVVRPQVRTRCGNDTREDGACEKRRVIEDVE